MVDKLCNSNDSTVLHSVCTTCSKYIGTFQSTEKVVRCDVCETNVDASNPSNPCYFAILDPSNAISEYLESNENFYDDVIKKRIHEKNTVKDIYDGKLYRDFVKTLSRTDRYNYVTVTFNTDGASKFESSTSSIWPIYLCINEILAQKRFDSVIVTGLWFGKNKPEIGIFLEPFIEKMNALSNNGIQCMIKGETRCIKVYTILSRVDSVARAPMQGSLQFNAHYGCEWCTHPGEYFNHSMRYPYVNPLLDNRNANTTAAFAEEAVRTAKPVFGIKTASPLLVLNSFDIIKGFTPDYMHCFLLGVAKQYTEYILNYISPSDYETVDYWLSNVKVPHQVCRLARPLSDRANWKSREWENWVLYYSVPLLTQVLKSNARLQHWALLTESLHIGLQTQILFEELNRLNELLHKFVSEAEDLYGLTAMTYNTHQLLHIAESIAN